MAHTPGPWHVQNDQYCHVTVYAGKQSIAYCGRAENTTEANARLIAAAPELLEALQTIQQRHKATAALNGHSVLYADDIRAIQAAIAKVEGR